MRADVARWMVQDSSSPPGCCSVLQVDSDELYMHIFSILKFQLFLWILLLLCWKEYVFLYVHLSLLLLHDLTVGFFLFSLNIFIFLYISRTHKHQRRVVGFSLDGWRACLELGGTSNFISLSHTHTLAGVRLAGVSLIWREIELPYNILYISFYHTLYVTVKYLGGW